MATTAICQTMLPIIPRKKKNGTKTAIVVRVEAVTGAKTLRTAFRAASAGAAPASSSCQTRSATTMAESTSIPTTAIIPKRESRLKVMPVARARTIIPETANGSESATQKATRRLRKRARTTSTRQSPCRPLRPSRLIRSPRTLVPS